MFPDCQGRIGLGYGCSTFLGIIWWRQLGNGLDWVATSNGETVIAWAFGSLFIEIEELTRFNLIC